MSDLHPDAEAGQWQLAAWLGVYGYMLTVEPLSVSWIWNTLVVPELGWPALSYRAALGLCLAAGCASLRWQAGKPSSRERALWQVRKVVVVALVCLVVLVVR